MVPPRRLLFDDYKTEDNSDSPIFLSLADIKSSHSESVISNDDNPERSLQSLENLRLFPKLKCYWCHLISKKKTIRERSRQRHDWFLDISSIF